ncbi:hypothetical protein HXX76_012515 [Chlamydomonas incerta]|uniref:Uncharacterized protein n=1 Tax=Chlamydomonas incerta TaxID=51695 RepID=A0A835SV32_CHLIN|nr:hypothetical protein HXX76_012515 [Chlamydomonas incerta]|eukprot:KAG2427320.1 hypothetical protein HXX76_012515 [Chlamydomonas incerta]
MTRKSWHSAPQERAASEGAHASDKADAVDWRRRQEDGPTASTSTGGCGRGGASSKRSCGHETKRHGDHPAAPQRHRARPPRPSPRNARTGSNAAGAPPTQEPQQPWHTSHQTTVNAPLPCTYSDNTSSSSCYSRYNASSGGSSSGGSSSHCWADMAEEDAALERAGMGLDLGELEAEHDWFKTMMAAHKAAVEAAQAAGGQAQPAGRRGAAAKRKAARRAAHLAAAAQTSASSSCCESAAPLVAPACTPSLAGVALEEQQEVAAGCGGRLSPVISSDCDCAAADAAEAPAAGARGASGSTRRGLHGGAYIRSLSLLSSGSGESWSSEEGKALDREFEALEAYCVAPDAAAKAAAVAKAAAAAKAAAVAAAKAVAEAWQKHEADVAAAVSGGGGGGAAADVSAAVAQVVAVVEMEAAYGCSGASAATAYERHCLSSACNCSYVFGWGSVA